MGLLARTGSGVSGAPQALRPLFVGVLAGAGLLLFYLGTITLAQDWEHARQQLWIDRWFAGVIVLGFGTQMGLYTFLRALHQHTHTRGVVASSGTSVTAMLACCAHHLVDVLPLIGLSGATIFLSAYKTPLLWLGIVMNGVGILYFLHLIRKNRQERR